jgi:hypothetical protein
LAASTTGGEMGERGKVARCADRALFRDQRHHALFQHAFDQAHQLKPHTGSATAQRNELEGHDQAHDIFRHGSADAAAMRQDEVALQGGGVGGVDLDRGQLAEAGVDAIDRLVAGGDGGDAGRCLLDCRIEAAVEDGILAVPVDRGQIGQRYGTGMKRDGHAWFPPGRVQIVASRPARMRACSGLKPMR